MVVGVAEGPCVWLQGCGLGCRAMGVAAGLWAGPWGHGICRLHSAGLEGRIPDWLRLSVQLQEGEA